MTKAKTPAKTTEMKSQAKTIKPQKMDATSDEAVKSAKAKSVTVAKTLPKQKTNQAAGGTVAAERVKKTPAPKKSSVAKAVAVATDAMAKPQVASARSKAKPQAAGPRIFQIYYQRQQIPLLDPEFEPYDNIGDKSPLLEFNVFLKLSLDEALQKAPLWGALSWKFSQKTGLSGSELKKLIADNPGYDVYYCNPHPETEALYHNLWLQGETTHPNFLVLCREFFECAGLSPELLTEIYPSRLYSAANYFVATPAFWARYLKFVGLALALANKRLSATTRAILYSSTADKRGMHAESSYIPFIVERLFSVFLILEGKDLKTFKLPLPLPESQLNVHLQVLRQMKDVAHAQRSNWLAACWTNYRTLYLSTMRDKAWLQKYLKAITPSKARFANFANVSK